MNILRKYSIAATVFFCSATAFAQGQPVITDPSSTQPADENAVNVTWKPSLVKDGVIDVVPHVNRSLEMNGIREIDAAWKRRVWREIDVRQKQNQPFIYAGDEYSGGGAFIEILINAIKKGKVAAYSMDDRFTTPLNMESFERTIGGTMDSVDVEDPNTGEMVRKYTRREFDVTSVTKYRLKEDWVFDRNLGRMVVRIIGIAPLQDVKSETTGDFMYSAPMFWLNYNELRKMLVNYEVYNPQNDLHRMTWADYFDNRYFASYVIKTSANNPTGADYGKGLRSLEEGERAIEVMREKEDDMWAK